MTAPLLLCKRHASENKELNGMEWGGGGGGWMKEMQENVHISRVTAMRGFQINY